MFYQNEYNGLPLLLGNRKTDYVLLFFCLPHLLEQCYCDTEKAVLSQGYHVDCEDTNEWTFPGVTLAGAEIWHKDIASKGSY